MKIYYLIPELHEKDSFSFFGFLRSIKNGYSIRYINRCFFRKHKPIGGVKVIYQHCLILKKLGYDVYPVLMGRYKGNFYGYDVECKSYEEVMPQITSSDIVVATEFRPYEGLLFKDAKKILFLQNWVGLRKWLKEEHKDKTYLDIGYDYVMTCSEYCTKYVEKHMGIPAKTVTNGLDLEVFKSQPNARVKNKVLAMSRKHPDDLKKIIALLKGSDYTFKVVDGLTQADLIREYQSADIFLATGYPEGFGLPPLEAMACGCVVVGFTGGGASEFMIDNETALIAEDGDVNTAAEKLRILASNPELKERIRKNGYKKSQLYSIENTEKQLSIFYADMLD